MKLSAQAACGRLHSFAARRRRSSVEHGFSALELMAVVALIGIMVLITAPAMLNFMSQMKIRTASHRMSAHLRLCRQVAVSQRSPVIMTLQCNNGATKPEYKAWVERSGNITRQANGADGTAGTEDDEVWVIQLERQMANDQVIFSDVYNQSDPSSPPGSSIVDTNKKVILRFQPNGSIQRLDTSSGAVQQYTMLRLRLQRRIHSTRNDIWDATAWQTGKVASEYSHTS